MPWSKAVTVMIKFYVQDKRQYVGNCIMWWRDGGGYTPKLDDAEVFTGDALPTDRETDVAWPKDYVDRMTRPMVDVQDVENPLRDDPRYKNPRVRAEKGQDRVD